MSPESALSRFGRKGRSRLLQRLGFTERGAVLVEAALAIPVILLIVVGALEMGFAWEAKAQPQMVCVPGCYELPHSAINHKLTYAYCSRSPVK